VIVRPINASTDLTEVFSYQDLLTSSRAAFFRAGTLHGVRSADDQQISSADFICIPNAIVFVDGLEILYMTHDFKYIPQLYPKPWPYQKYRFNDSDKLMIDVDRLPRKLLADNYLMPFSVAGNWFHRLLDNYARLFFTNQLPFVDDLTLALPFWACPETQTVPSDLATVHAVFLNGRSAQTLEAGLYQVDRLIAPPLGNADDYIFAEPARFISDGLCSALTSRRATHPLRLFVSRADTAVRTLINEAELVHELQRLGFTILCPGEYSFIAQLGIFAAAEIVVGIHGQGLLPIICAQNCRALLEFEAAGWSHTPYCSIAQILDIPYHKMPCELVEYRDTERFDWHARADVPACLDIMEGILRAI
jgi:hypothetical protein